MNDDQMDEMLIEGVRDYNAPRDVPREELWNRIAAARAEQRATVVRPGRVGTAGRWLGIGVAAAAILTIGVIIGRSFNRTSVATVPTVAKAPEAAPPAAGAATTTRDSLIDQIHQETTRTGRRVRELASAETRTSQPNENLAYRLVVLQHLAGSEAMITAFRSGARGGEMDAQLATWSKELLSTTRLLEASQAAGDPVMQRLLGDLDLVISQIVQYTTRGTANTEDLDLIEQTINKRGVMTKLRNPGRGVAAGL